MNLYRNPLACSATMAAMLAVPTAGCNRQPSPDPHPVPFDHSNASTPQPPALPDLAISAIQIVPRQPVAGQRFALNVYVTNQGHTRSGPFELVLYMRDVSRGSTYPIGTFRHGPMNPGENYPVYASTDRLVNFRGPHQLHVNVTPMGFADSWLSNNVTVMAFNVR